MKTTIMEKLNQLGITNFFAILAAFLAPIKALMIIVGVCILSDTFTGIWKAKKKGDKITSRKLSAVISKMVLYQGAIVLIYCIEKFIIADFIGYFVDIPLFLTKLVAAILCFIELMSINENYTAISGVSIWSKFKEMIKRAKEVKEEVESLKGEKPEKSPEIGSNGPVNEDYESEK